VTACQSDGGLDLNWLVGLPIDALVCTNANPVLWACMWRHQHSLEGMSFLGACVGSSRCRVGSDFTARMSF